MIEPADTTTSVRKTITVDVPIARAFEVFTTDFDRWWPRTHHIGATDMAEAIMEGRQGGRWYERGVDGSECAWGSVLVYEPPGRLVLAWQLDNEFHYDKDLHTEVEVRFTAERPDRTRVDLEHRGLDQYGEDQDKMRATFDSDGGWTGLLHTFAVMVGTGSDETREVI